MISKAIVIDDDPASAEVIAKLLRYLGCSVTVCTDAEQAVVVALAEDVDLVSLDIHMPQLDGFDVLSLIRSHEHTRRAPNVPVMAVTGRVADGDRAATIAAGFAAHVGKPVLLDELRRSLECISALRSDQYRKRYSVDEEAIVARVGILSRGAGQSRLQFAAGLAMTVEHEGQALLERALRDAYSGNDARAAQHVGSLVGIADAVGAARLIGHCRSFENAISSGRSAFEQEAVLLRAELDRVICSLREQVLPVSPSGHSPAA